MPEIPEMEIYRNFLLRSVLGKRITETVIQRERSINTAPDVFRYGVRGAVIVEVMRRGKYILLALSSGRFLIAHMMLDGRIYLESAGTYPELPGKAYVSLQLDDGSQIHFCELRLGYLKLLDEAEVKRIVDGLGVEPLSEDFTLPAFLEILKQRKGMIKPLLMDQKTIAGIGNAYSNESLFAAGILPERKVTALSVEEKEGLYQSIGDTLRLALAKGGYIEDKFAAWDDFSGGFIPFFQVYDRTGQPCLQCGAIIEQKAVGGRNAYFCPICQH